MFIRTNLESIDMEKSDVVPLKKLYSMIVYFSSLQFQSCIS